MGISIYITNNIIKQRYIARLRPRYHRPGSLPRSPGAPEHGVERDEGLVSKSGGARPSLPLRPNTAQFLHFTNIRWQRHCSIILED